MTSSGSSSKSRHRHSSKSASLNSINARLGGVNIRKGRKPVPGLSEDDQLIADIDGEEAEMLLKRIEHMLDMNSQKLANGNADGDRPTPTTLDFDYRRLLGRGHSTSTASATESSHCAGNNDSPECQKPQGTNALPIGLGVGIPLAIAVCILVFLHFRHLRVLKREEEADKDIDVDVDDTEHFGMQTDKFAPRLDYASSRKGSLETIRTIRSNMTNASYNYGNEAYPMPFARSNSDVGYKQQLNYLGDSRAYPSNASVYSGAPSIYSRSESPTSSLPSPKLQSPKQPIPSPSSLRHEALSSARTSTGDAAELPKPPAALTAKSSGNIGSTISAGSSRENFSNHRDSESSDLHSDRVFSEVSAGATSGTSPDTSSVDSKLGKHLMLAEPELAVVRDRNSRVPSLDSINEKNSFSMPRTSTLNENLDKTGDAHHLPRFSIASSAEMISEDDDASEASFDISARKSTVAFASSTPQVHRYSAAESASKAENEEKEVDEVAAESKPNETSLTRSDTKHFDRVKSIYREYMPEDEENDEDPYGDGNYYEQPYYGGEQPYHQQQGDYYHNQGPYRQDYPPNQGYYDQGGYYEQGSVYNDQGSYYAAAAYGPDGHYAGSVAPSTNNEPSKAVTPISDLPALPTPHNISENADPVAFAQRKRVKAGGGLKADGMLPAFNPLNNWNGTNGSALPSAHNLLRQSVAMIDSIEFAPPKKFNNGSNSGSNSSSRNSSANNSMMSSMSSARQLAARPYSKLVPDAKSDDQLLRPKMDMMTR